MRRLSGSMQTWNVEERGLRRSWSIAIAMAIVSVAIVSVAISGIVILSVAIVTARERFSASVEVAHGCALLAFFFFFSDCCLWEEPW
jgi:hypothetical protein